MYFSFVCISPALTVFDCIHTYVCLNGILLPNAKAGVFEYISAPYHNVLWMFNKCQCLMIICLIFRKVSVKHRFRSVLGLLKSLISLDCVLVQFGLGRHFLYNIFVTTLLQVTWTDSVFIKSTANIYFLTEVIIFVSEWGCQNFCIDSFDNKVIFAERCVLDVCCGLRKLN